MGDGGLDQSGTCPQWALGVVPEASLSLFCPNRDGEGQQGDTAGRTGGRHSVGRKQREIYVVREEGTSKRRPGAQGRDLF